MAERIPKLNSEINTEMTKLVALLSPKTSSKKVSIIKIVIGKKSFSFLLLSVISSIFCVIITHPVYLDIVRIIGTD
jgi:hypothetical protein